MPDDKSQTGNRHRSQAAGAEDYEVRQLAERTGIPAHQARELFRRHGNDRAKLEEVALALQAD